MSRDIPPQEQNRKWFRSHLLNRELELQELYDVPQGELDLVMAKNLKLAPQLAQRCTKDMNQIKALKSPISPQVDTSIAA